MNKSCHYALSCRMLIASLALAAASTPRAEIMRLAPSSQSSSPAGHKALCPSEIRKCPCGHMDIYRKSKNAYDMGEANVGNKNYALAYKEFESGISGIGNQYLGFEYYGEMPSPPDSRVSRDVDRRNFESASLKDAKILRYRLREFRRNLKICAATKP
jgi:hypothetical protein